MKSLLQFITVLIISCMIQGVAAQTIGVSCPKFFSDRHQAVSCTEAVFAQNNYHFTLASLPPSNGFGPGLVLIKKFRGTVGTPARENSFDISLTGAVTTNSSWFAGGAFSWVPPLPYKSDSSVAGGQRLWKLKSLSRAAMSLSAGHRTVRTLYYYGLGSASPNTQFLFAQDDTWADATAKMPLTRWLTVIGESGVRSITLPTTRNLAVLSSNFTAASTPGIMAQPLYLLNLAGIQTVFTPRASKPLRYLPKQNDPHFQSLLLFNLSNIFSFQWHQPADGSPYGFRQFVYDGDQTMVFHRVLRNFFPETRHPVIRYMCEGNKRTDECSFGQFDLKGRLVITQTSNGNQIPFYLQPTLGGTDIDSRVTLRGWDNYRFRAPDLSLLQFEYGVPVYDPLGVFVFYDAGTVGNGISDLTIRHFRHDGGFGLFVRLRGHMVAQTYYAFGAGNGGNWNYNFAKEF